MNGDVVAALGRIERQMRKPVLPYWYPPPGSFFQDAIGQGATTLGVWTTFFEFRVPSQRRAMITKLGIEPNDPAASATASFRFLINNTPHYNYQAPPVLLGTIDNPADIYIPLEGDQVVQLQVNDSAVISHIVFYRLWYWTWDEQLFMRPGEQDEMPPVEDQ